MAWWAYILLEKITISMIIFFMSCGTFILQWKIGFLMILNFYVMKGLYFTLKDRNFNDYFFYVIGGLYFTYKDRVFNDYIY